MVVNVMNIRGSFGQFTARMDTFTVFIRLPDFFLRQPSYSLKAVTNDYCVNRAKGRVVGDCMGKWLPGNAIVRFALKCSQPEPQRFFVNNTDPWLGLSTLKLAVCDQALLPPTSAKRFDELDGYVQTLTGELRITAFGAECFAIGVDDFKVADDA